MFTPFAFVKQEAAPAPSIDPDAQAYIDEVIAAGGTLSGGNQTAIDDFYKALKANSLYSEILYMYPFMGGTAASHAICGINPTDGDYTLTWGGNLTNALSHTSAGVSTLTVGKGYGNMGVNTSVIHSSVNSVTLGAYITEATTNDQGFLITKTGNVVLGDSRYQLNIPFDDDNCYTAVGSPLFSVYDNGSTPDGRWYGSRTSSTSLTLYKNGNSVATNTSTNSGVANLSNDPPAFFAPESQFAASAADCEVAFIFGGNGLSSSEISTLDGILSTFQTAIGR